MSKYGTLKVTPGHMNVAIVEKWESLKLSLATIAQDNLKKTNLTPLSPPYKGTDHQACLAATQNSKYRKSDDK